MCMAKCACAVCNRFFVDLNITGYISIHSRPITFFFFFCPRFYNISRVILTQISVRLKKFASTIKLAFIRHIQWIFELLSWCDARSIICLAKLNHTAIVKLFYYANTARARIFLPLAKFTRFRISPYGENCRRRFRVASFMGICSHIYIPLVKGEDWYCTRRVDQSKCTDGRNARGGKSNIIVEREW